MFFSFSPQMPLVDLDDDEERSDNGYKNFPIVDGTCFDPAKGLAFKKLSWWKFWNWDSGTRKNIGICIVVIVAIVFVMLVWKCLKSFNSNIIVLAGPKNGGAVLEFGVPEQNQTAEHLAKQSPASTRYCIFGHALVR